MMHVRSTVVMACLVTLACKAPAQGAQPSEDYRRIVAEYWDDLLKRHPIEATLYVGDHRYDDRLDDPSLEAYAAWLAQLRKTHQSLTALDAASLSPDDQIDRRVLMGMIGDRLDLEKFGDHLIPLLQIARASTDVRTDDLHLVFTQLGEFHPAGTAGDVVNFLKRLEAFPTMVERLIGVLKQGLAEKRVPPRVAMARVLVQLKSLANPKAKDHPLWAYVDRLPRDWPTKDRTQAEEHIRKAIEETVAPAYGKLAAFVESTYLPACRDSVGLRDTPDGPAHYALLVRHYTTTDATPDAIHALGLEEVARNREAMDKIRVKVGFTGDLPAFFKAVRADPKLKCTSEKMIVDGHKAIIAMMQANLPRLFGKIPSTPIEVRPFDPIRAKSAPGGEYLPVPSDGSRPGIFFVNASDPTTRPTYTMQALAYHEAVPGHHFQMSLSLESPGRPPFRRYFYLPAFDEGWALYSEGLPGEIGLYTDPYAEFGRLNYDAFRSARLVIDTGIHAKGWSRDQAIAYFEANTTEPRNMIENEVDRYIAWPGQALAYKVGELTIRGYRAEASTRAGASFDIRAFHDRLLAHGSLPLTILKDVMAAPELRGGR
jgi:uncharacterized protein (DUF885 family)